LSFVVADADTGEILESHNPLRSLPPASVMKAIAGFYALEMLGPEFIFETKLIATGQITDGVLDGDLILIGGGDPTLDTDDLYDLCRMLQDKKIKALTGKFAVYSNDWPSFDSIDADQPSHLGYNPSLSGLNLNLNRVFFEWKLNEGKYDLFLEARGLKARPTVDCVDVRISNTISSVFEYKKLSDKEAWSVARSALGKEGGRWLPVRNPELYSGQVFQKLALDLGINLPSPNIIFNKPSGYILASHKSEILSEMTKSMLKYSTNITAELLGITASKKSNLVTSLASSSHMMGRWLDKKYGLSDISLVDHSGLNDQSTISSNSMVKVLLDKKMQTQVKPLLKKIPYRQKKGQPIFGGETKIVGKTGTLHFVSGLAGYIDNSKGRNLAFAIFVSDMRKRRNLEKNQKESPRGSSSWNNSARYFQRLLINRWCRVYV
jgi:D-alanyl-D-alanine carboxypeptidase/D-alanyl-D-alanine-endopeptidase (penicillin-binding protein 4)